MQEEDRVQVQPIIRLGADFEKHHEQIKQHLLHKFGDSAAYLFNVSNFPWDEANVAQIGDNQVTREAKMYRMRSLSDRFEDCTRHNAELCVYLVEMLSPTAREQVMENEKFVTACDQRDPVLMWNIITEECSSGNTGSSSFPKHEYHKPSEHDQICYSEVGGLKVQIYQ